MTEDIRELKARLAQAEEKLRLTRLEEAHKVSGKAKLKGTQEDLLEYDVMEVLKRGIALGEF